MGNFKYRRFVVVLIKDNGDFSDAATDGVVPFVNAVEIDWNGAQLGDKTLNTTGEVLSRYKVAI